jgi:hypothetical protein
VGKYGAEYKRVERDLYPTIDPRPIAALSEHFDFAGRTIWECAAGDGDLATAMTRLGARVFCTDIEQRGFRLDQVYDFVNGEPAPTCICDIVTNPPTGKQGKLGEAFIAAGLRHIGPRGLLALLLPSDFDCAIRRQQYFAACESFAAKLIILNGRLIWFRRNDGIKEAPRGNYAWFLWSRRMREQFGRPTVFYATGIAARGACHG